ncbi:MAG TPA: energy transducer TonB [Pyrinomonadaceae bacterium]
MKSAVNKSERRALGVCLGVWLLSLLLGSTFVRAQEAPRPEGSSQIKPPMMKPSMNRTQNANGGRVNAAPRRRKATRRRRRAQAKLTTVREMADMPTEINAPAVPRAAAVPRRTRTVSAGVLNGRARSLPQPQYPAIAKSARASGTVVVQVTIDELGDVISARAVSGHALLREAALDAARQAKFTPTVLAGRPVQVTGTISYNFVP